MSTEVLDWVAVVLAGSWLVTVAGVAVGKVFVLHNRVAMLEDWAEHVGSELSEWQRLGRVPDPGADSSSGAA